MAIWPIGSEAKQSFAAVRAQAELGHEDHSILDPRSSILHPPSSILHLQIPPAAFPFTTAEGLAKIIQSGIAIGE
ncbi:MAG: hypothetical protein ACJ8FY_20540 [Gemmataceae bacterium]